MTDSASPLGDVFDELEQVIIDAYIDANQPPGHTYHPPDIADILRRHFRPEGSVPVRVAVAWWPPIPGGVSGVYPTASSAGCLHNKPDAEWEDAERQATCASAERIRIDHITAYLVPPKPPEPQDVLGEVAP